MGLEGEAGLLFRTHNHHLPSTQHTKETQQTFLLTPLTGPKSNNSDTMTLVVTVVQKIKKTTKWLNNTPALSGIFKMYIFNVLLI